MVNPNDPMEFGSGGEEIAEDVLMGDNIAILCQNYAYENLQILLVDKPLHMMTWHFKDDWGQEWFEGDYVICGLWYKRLHHAIGLTIC